MLLQLIIFFLIFAFQSKAMAFEGNNGSFRYKWLGWILSPFFISFFVTVLLILLFFPDVPKYTLAIKDSKKLNYGLAFYDDLKADGVSDFIDIRQERHGRIALNVREYPSGRVNQWNFEGELLTITNDYIFTGDFDQNQQKELYIFSRSHDSLQLHCIRDFTKNEAEFKNVFIAHIGYRRENYQASIVKAEMDDLNEDGYKELIFGANSGFSLTPRNVFAYDVFHKKCINSPYLGQSIFSIVQKDITGDEKNEILLQCYGPDNISDTTIKYHDRSVWLMVLDRKLNFLFEPIEFKGAYSEILPFVFENENQPNQAGFYIKSGQPPFGAKLCLFSKDGKIIKEREFPEVCADGIFKAITFNENDASRLMLSMRNINELLVVNQELEITETMVRPGLETVSMLDLDNDGKNEIVAFNSVRETLTIMRDDLQFPVSVEIIHVSDKEPLLSMKKNRLEPIELAVSDSPKLTYLAYTQNTLYYTRWLIFLGIYLGILFFVWFIRRVQRFQIDRKLETEKKITELQMKIVKNQLNPHFTLNAVNSIIYAVGNNEPARATEHLYQFANLYRHLLLTSDQFACTLKDEIVFTTNYLKMEQLRCRDKFTYSILMHDDVNQELEVPKMCIQTAVENAVKHGIAPLSSGGNISITALNSGNRLIIEISDNGIGREDAKKYQSSSTGMGAKMTQQYFELYYKITGRKVLAEIIDLLDDSAKSIGTKVRITIQIK